MLTTTCVTHVLLDKRQLAIAHRDRRIPRQAVLYVNVVVVFHFLNLIILIGHLLLRVFMDSDHYMVQSFEQGLHLLISGKEMWLIDCVHEVHNERNDDLRILCFSQMVPIASIDLVPEQRSRGCVRLRGTLLKLKLSLFAYLSFSWQILVWHTQAIAIFQISANG